MKMIDLLNKKANNEKIPYIIGYGVDMFYLKKGTYYLIDGDNEPHSGIMLEDMFSFDSLNDEIEILKEKKEKIEKLDFTTLNTQKEKNKAMKDTINEIIDKIDELENKNE